MPEMTAPAGPVLLVDDDAAFTDLVGRQLEARGYQVVTAGSVEGCRRVLDQGLRPALVLLDINLPGETGWSLLRGRAYVAAGRPRVIVVSATRISSSRLREFGVAGYLPKPFAMETLLETVRRYTADEAVADVAGELREPMDVEML